MAEGDDILVRTLEFIARHPPRGPQLDPVFIDSFIEEIRTLPAFESGRLRLSIDIVSKSSEWYIAASTNRAAETWRRHPTTLGLTGWAVRTKRPTHLHARQRHQMPIDVVFLPEYDRVCSAFLWVFRLGTEAVAALCVVSDEEGAVTDEIAWALRRVCWHIKASLVGLDDVVDPAGGRERSRADSTDPPSLRIHAGPADGPTFIAWLRTLFHDRCPEYEHAYFWRWDQARQCLEPLHFWKDEAPLPGWPGPLARGKGFIGRCAETLEPLLENDIRDGRGFDNGIETPFPEMRPGVKLGSLLAYPVKDAHRFHGVLAVISEVPGHFHFDAKLDEVANLIAHGFQQDDSRRLERIQADILKDLQEALLRPEPPGAFWKRLTRVLGELERYELCTAAALYVGKRHQPNVFVCKSASPRAAELGAYTITSDDNEMFRTLLDDEEGVHIVGRELRRPPLKLVLPDATTQYWVKQYPSDARRPNLPSFLALATLPRTTPWLSPFGVRPVAPLLSQIFGTVFAHTRAVLTTADFARIGTERMNALSAATHNLRAPVAALHSQAQLLKDLSPPNEDIRGEILRKANEAMHRIDNVLYQWIIVKDESHARTRDDEVEPTLFVTDVVTQAKALTLGNINLEVDRSVQPGHILRIKRFSVGLALTNVIENAVKFGRQQPVYVRVRTDAPDRGMSSPLKLVITVRDHGIGIPIDNLKVIFQPGRQHRYSRQFLVSGAGIGLSITKAIVEDHGGKIWASPLGIKQGSEFNIVLPAYRR